MRSQGHRRRDIAALEIARWLRLSLSPGYRTLVETNGVIPMSSTQAEMAAIMEGKRRAIPEKSSTNWG